MSARTGFFLHPASSLHDTGWGHPEHQGRLRALASTVGKDLLTLHGHVEQMSESAAAVVDLLRVHTLTHVDHVRRACAMAEERKEIVAIDTDTKVSSASWEAAIGSAGTAIAAAEAVANGSVRTAFVATRPPGHHATPDRAMGFCLLNNVAIVARWLQATGRGHRILIVDWDVHHGNGTQDVFYDDPSVFFLSLHQWPHYPGSGSSEEQGRAAGEGFTRNVPLPAGISRSDYLRRFYAELDRTTSTFEPDFVLVSCGFDSMAGDPLGGFPLEPQDLYAMTLRVVDVATASCRGQVVVLLEGGYNPPRVGTGAVAVIRALAGLDDPES